MLGQRGQLMKRKAVKSSMIRSIGYDPKKKLLEVEFMSRGVPGSIYHYFNIPKETHNELMKAKSKGSYFATTIKDIYTYEKKGGDK